VGRQTEDRSRLVASTANRLRLIQIDFADERPDVRRGYLAEAVEGALADVLPDQRETFLRELMDRFPTWDPNVVVTAPQEEPGVQSRLDERELQDPSFLVERLAGLAPQLADEDRQRTIAQLRDAGLAPQQQGALPDEALVRVRRALELDPNAPLDALRLLNLLGTLVEFVCALDPLVWRTWGALAPAARLQSIAALKHVLSRYALGDTAVTDAQAEEDLLKLRHLIASFVVALSQAGRIAATDVVTALVAPLAPAKIQDLVKFERGSIFVAEEVRCWRKYKELSAKITDVAVEGAIKEKIQRFVEELMKRRAPGPPPITR